MQKLNIYRVYRGLSKEIYILFLSRVINCLGGFILPLLTLIATEKIGLNAVQSGLFIAIFTLSQAPFLMLGGKMTDHFDPRKVIVIFSICGSIVYVVCSFLSPSILMGVLLILASDFFVFTYPAFNKIIAQISSEEHLKQSYSLMYLAYNVGYAVGPMIGALLFVNHLSLLFIIDAATTLISVVLILLFVRSKSDRDKSETLPVEPEEISSILPFLRAHLFLIVFCLMFMIYNLTYNQWYFMLPMQMRELFGQNGVKLFSMLVSLNALVVILATPILTALTDKMKPLSGIIIGGILYAVSGYLFSLNGALIFFLISVFVLTIGEVLTAIYTNVYLAQQTPICYLGRMNSVFMLISGIGNTLAPIIAGWLLMSYGYPLVWLVFTFVILIGVGGLWILRKVK